jgi:hypothetical protein
MRVLGDHAPESFAGLHPMPPPTRAAIVGGESASASVPWLQACDAADGEVTALEPATGGETSRATDANGAGQIIGHAAIGGEKHAVLAP